MLSVKECSDHSSLDALGNSISDETEDDPVCCCVGGDCSEEEEEEEGRDSNVALGGQHSTAGRGQHYIITE